MHQLVEAGNTTASGGLRASRLLGCLRLLGLWRLVLILFAIYGRGIEKCAQLFVIHSDRLQNSAETYPFVGALPANHSRFELLFQPEIALQNEPAHVPFEHRSIGASMKVSRNSTGIVQPRFVMRLMTVAMMPAPKR